MAKDYLLYGRNILEEALAVAAPISEVFCFNPEARAYCENLALRYKRALNFKKGLPREIEKHGHQGVAFRTTHSFYLEDKDVTAKQYPFIVCCNHLEDVQNLGSIVRSAAAFGVGLIVHEERRSASLTATAVKVSAGQAFRVKFLAVSNLAPFLKSAKRDGFAVAGLSGDSRWTLYEWKPQFPLILVIGSESDGISKPVTNEIDEQICIPMKRGVESLNAHIAAAVAMSWVYSTGPHI